MVECMDVESDGGKSRTATAETVCQVLVNGLRLGPGNLDTGRPLGDQLDSLQLAEAAVVLSQIGIPVHDFRLPSRTPAELEEYWHQPGAGSYTASPPVDIPSQHQTSESGMLRRPPLRTPNLQLTPVTAENFPFLYALAIDEEVGYRWRFRGSIPSPEDFQKAFWQGTLTQFVVNMTSAAESIGHVVCYAYEPGHQHAFVGMVFAPPVLGTGLPLEAASCFLNYLFNTWNLRKLYFEVPEFNYPQFASGAGRYFHEEGRLRQHEFYAGRYWDKLYLAIYRDDVIPPAAPGPPFTG